MKGIKAGFSRVVKNHGVACATRVSAATRRRVIATLRAPQGGSGPLENFKVTTLAALF